MKRLLDPIFPEDTLPVSPFGNWITHPNHSRKDDFAFLARRRINCEENCAETMLRICAHSRYVLYLNGECVAMGPVKASDSHFFYDSYPVGALLHKGENHVAVAVYHSGMSCRTSVPGHPALWLRLDSVSESAEPWETMEDPSLLPNAPEFTFQMGFSAYRDLRLEPNGWQTFSDTNETWSAAEERSSADYLRGRALVPRDIPALTQDQVLPRKLVDRGYVPPSSVDDYARLIDEEQHECNEDAFDEATGQLVKPSEQGGVYLLYDFGREFFGSVIIDIDAPAGTVLDVAFNEALADGRLSSYFRFCFKPKAVTKADGYRFADRYVLREGNNRIEHRFQDRGGRYVQLVVRGGDAEARLNRISVEDRVYPIDESAGFDSDNPLYNQLWKMCSHTVRHCVNDTFVDCPWREQAFWINDLLVANLYYFLLSADPALPRRCLKMAADGFRKFGFMPAVYPAADTMFFLSMPSIWTMVLDEFHRYSGDTLTVKDLEGTMDDILAVYEPLIDDTGLVANHQSWWNFVDIGYADAKVELKGHAAILNMLIATAYTCAARLCAGAKSLKYQRQAATFLAALERRLWNTESHCFRDSDAPGYGFETFSVHPHALALVYDLFPAKRRELLAAVKNSGAIQAEPYFQRYVLEALADNGEHAEADAVVRRLWGRMAAENSPTVWELAAKGPRPLACASLCHAFSCAPLAHFHRNLVGVRPLKPGFEEFSFTPLFHEVKKFHFRQPTPRGIIAVDSEGSSATITVPTGTTAITAEGKRLSAGTHKLAF